MTLPSLLALLVLVLVHVFADRLRFSTLPRSKWLSFAGGISVAYVFIQILCELQAYQEHIAEHEWAAYLIKGKHTYLFALVGLTFFYGLERTAKLSADSTRERSDGEEKQEELEVFWIHVICFCIYNLIIGYLLSVEEHASLWVLALYTIAMALHLMVNDYGLQDHYRQGYRKKGRWLLVASLVLGWVIGALTEVPEAVIGAIFSFIAGGVIMNVLKEELPEERKSNFWAFATGVVLYAVLLLSS